MTIILAYTLRLIIVQSGLGHFRNEWLIHFLSKTWNTVRQATGALQTPFTKFQ